MSTPSVTGVGADGRSVSARLILRTIIVGSLLTGCGEGGDSGRWIHTSSVAGTVTTVTTISGSIWGGPAALHEEAIIGSREGPEAYLLGSVSSIWADDGRIFLIDGQAPAVRVFDMDGRHLLDIGRKGGGPGEYAVPTSVVVHPGDGSVFVSDGWQSRLIRYDRDGRFVENWPIPGGGIGSRQLMALLDGTIYAPTAVSRNGPPPLWKWGMSPRGPEGETGPPRPQPDLEFQRQDLVARAEGRIDVASVPFSPQALWVMDPSARMIGGVGSEYRITIGHPDGATTVISKNDEGVGVDTDEAAWYRARMTASMRSVQPGWVWDGPPIPPTKPFFSELMPDRNGRIWVWRPGPGIRLSGCEEDPAELDDFYRDPCWEETGFFDVFDVEGRYLGLVEVPRGFGPEPPPFIAGDTVIAAVMGEDGAPTVRRFRLTY